MSDDPGSSSVSDPSEAGSTATRGAWLLVDQGTNSLFSLAIGVVAAQRMDTETFGLFSVFFTVYLLSRDLVRSFIIDPLVISHAGRDVSDQVARVLSLCLLGALIATAGAMPFLGKEGRSLDTIALVAGAFGLLLMVDALRGVSIAVGRPAASAVRSIALLIGLGAGLVLISSEGRLQTLITMAAVSGAAGYMAAAKPSLPTTDLKAAGRWFAAHLRLGAPLEIGRAHV